MMIQAVSLLHQNASPTNQQIRAALDGHICRCGTHMRVMAAVEKAAQDMRTRG
jgi:aerobic-type carbon monoxide dehydrogenase small subunit (CoxS/CutS family)